MKNMRYEIDKVFQMMKDRTIFSILGKNNARDRRTRKRIRVFMEKGIYCSCCGAKGEYFDVQGKNITLFAKNPYGHKTIMTVDHIIPRSKGGTHEMKNLQSMCLNCNGKKSDKVPVGYWAPKDDN